jgi:hypothetical protein
VKKKKSLPADRVAQKASINAARAEQGPPFCYLLLDQESVKCLALGAVNARCEIQARRLVEALYPTEKSGI